MELVPKTSGRAPQWQLGRHADTLKPIRSIDGLGEIRFVLRIRLPVSHLDVNPTRRKDSFLQSKVDIAEIGRFAECAKPVQPFTALIVNIDPGARRLSIFPARWQV